MVVKIQATNFLSWKSLTFDITNGITLIDGWNEDDQTSEGSGKSAVFNALSWGLYGKIPKDINIDDVIKHGEKSCDIEVWFESGHVVKRSRKPNELMLLEYDGENFKAKKGKDARETQQMIEEFIGLSFDAFCQSVYFAQNNDKKFISANQEDRGKILSEIQDLQLFDKARKEAMTLLKIENENLIKMKHGIDLTKKDLIIVCNSIQLEEQKLKTQENQHKIVLDNIKLSIQEVDNKIKQTDVSLETSNAKLKDLQLDPTLKDQLNASKTMLLLDVSDIKSKKSNIDSLIAEKNRKESEGQRYGQNYNQLKTKIENINNFLLNPNGVHSIGSDYRRLHKTATDLQKHIDNPSAPCPTCGTNIDTDPVSLNQAELELDDIGTKIEELISEYGHEAEIMTKDSALIIEHLNMLSKELQVEVPSVEQLNAEIETINVKLRKIDDDLCKIETIERTAVSTRAQIQQIESQKEQLRQDLLYKVNSYKEVELNKPQLDTYNLEMEVREKGILDDKLDSLIKLSNEKQIYISRLEKLKAGFKDIKSYVFASVLNEINARVQKYLDKLFEMPVKLRFTNDNMKIGTDVTINGNKQILGLASGGQFRRFSLAADMALSDVVSNRQDNNIGVLILDEPFQNLSEQSMEKCIILLESKKQPVLIIEHNSIAKTIVNNTFEVRYEKGTSKSV